MEVDQYFADLSAGMSADAKAFAEAYKNHRPSSGTAKEKLILDFLENHVPSRFGITSGFVIDISRKISAEIDAIIYDSQNNSPFFNKEDKKFCISESVYAAIEIKTRLDKQSMQDSISKCIKFKNLRREFLEGPFRPTIKDSLFIIWGFDCGTRENLVENYEACIAGLDEAVRPDIIIVPNRFFITSGSYLRISQLGQKNSSYEKSIDQNDRQKKEEILERGYKGFEVGDHSLMGFFIFFRSWLQMAGVRTCELTKYLPKDKEFGVEF